MSNIRVTYSGLVAFVVGLVSVVTGLVFTLIVTRQLSAEEFGTWGIIGSTISYFLLSEVIIDFWTVRQISRGEEVGRTSLISSLIFSVGAIPFYLVLASIISTNSNANLELMLFGAILVPVYFVSQILTVINTSYKPQNTSYSLLVFEFSKIPAAFSLVFFLDLGLYGVIVAVLIAYLVRISVQIHFAKPKLKEKINFGFLKRWIKLSWLSLYSSSPRFIGTLDIIFYPLITGSVIGIAFYSASFAIANLVAHSGLISQALYPKLLANGSFEHIKENFSLLMYFGIPLLGISVIFSEAALFALNPIYMTGSLIVVFLGFRTFFSVLNLALKSVLLGIDKVDVEQTPSFSKLTKSKIFFVSTIEYIKFGIYISLIIIIIMILNSSDISEVEIVITWSIVALSIELPFFIYMWILVQRNTNVQFPYKNTLKYLGATISFVVVFLFTSKILLTYPESIYDFLPQLILQLVICIGVYLSITYVIDKKTKLLFKSIIQEFYLKK